MRKLTLLLALAATVQLAAQTSTVTVEVDASRPGAPVRDLNGVNKKPTFPSETNGPLWNGATLYSAFGVTQIRLHDSGIDVCEIYKAGTSLNAGVTPATVVPGCYLKGDGGPPHLRWTPNSSADADLNNPNNYNFTTADEALSAAVSTGAAVYLRLGESYNGPNDTGDAVAWAKVATNIYKHVIGQFKPTAGLSAVAPVFVEVFNEPDGQFWRGDTATFDTLFVETVTRVRAAAAAAKKTVIIGGPGFTKDILQKARTAGNPANGFIASVGASNLDFYSAHLYETCATTTTAAPAAWLRSLRALVDSQGGQGKPIHITEWNIGLGEQCSDTQFADQRLQSYTSAVLTFMQDPAQNIQAAHFYSGMPLMALFDFLAQDGVVRINPSAWAFWAHAKLLGGDLIDTQVCPASKACTAGYASETAPVVALATRTPSATAPAGSSTTAGQSVVITNDGTAAVTYTLRLKGLTAALVNVTISTPPSGTRDVVLKGTNPIAADSAALTALLNAVPTDVRSRLQPSGGTLDLVLTIPAHTLQVVQVRSASL